MKFDLTLGLADRPGQLLKALEPIAKNGGNILSIFHEREKTTGGYVPVSLVVDFPNKGNFENAKEELSDIGISIIKSEEVVEKVNATFILIGKVNVREIAEMKIAGVKIVDLEVLTPTSTKACIRLGVEAPLRKIDKIVTKLKESAKEMEAILISSL